MKDSIRVLIVGDEKVGKTSLIKAYTSEQLPSELPNVHPPVKFPKELSEAHCDVTMIDTFYRRDREADGTIEEELCRADVVLVVYDVTRPETIDRLRAFWLHFITSTCDLPIILVGNKADLKQENGNSEQFEDIMRPLAKEYRQCEIIIEVSAKKFTNLSELFMCMSRVVLYPSPPLYDSVYKELTPGFEKALRLIFRRCDQDKDFHLNDKEFLELQEEVFANQLEPLKLDWIKELIQEQCEHGITAEGINIWGFLHLNKMMIQRLKIDVCWHILSHFGFDKNLEIPIEYPLKLKPSQSVELSRTAITFLVSVFKQFSRGEALPFNEIKEIFSTVSTAPWEPSRSDDQAWRKIEKIVPLTPDFCLDLHAWLALWHLLTLQDFSNTLKYLVYIGFPFNYSEAFFLTGEKDVMKVSSKKVLCGVVVGDTGVGKSKFIDCFLGDTQTEARPSSTLRWACKVMKQSAQPWDSRYLALVEVPLIDLHKMPEVLPKCDVLVMLTDDSAQANQYLECQINVSPYIPKIKVVTKSEEPLPNHVDMEVQVPAHLYSEVFNIAVRPLSGLDKDFREGLIKKQKEKLNSSLIRVGVAVSVAIMGFFTLRKLIPK